MFDTYDDAPQSDHYENDYANYWMQEGVGFQIYKPTVGKITLAIAKEIVEGRRILTRGKPTLIVADLTSFRKIDIDAMEYFIHDDNTSDMLAGALLAHNYLQYTIAYFFLMYNQKDIPYPTTVVKSRRAGIRWLKEIAQTPKVQARLRLLQETKGGL